MCVVVDGKEHYGIIYKIENTISHHVYIGQTISKNGFNDRYKGKGKGIERVYNYYISRKNMGMYYNVHLFRAIEKYGFDAFVVDEVLDVAESFDELNDKEIMYIERFDSFHNGYNLTSGGDSRCGYQKPSGKDCNSSKRVCQIGTDGKLIKVWESTSLIEKETGISKGSISNVCLGRKGTAGGYVWIHEEDYDPNADYSRVVRDKTNYQKPILQLDNDGNVMREFASGNEASDVLGISKQEVSRICLGQRKKPKYNLIHKNKYMEEQRLSVNGLCEAS